MPAMRWGSARTPSGAGRESVAADSESDLFSAAKDGDRRALGRLLSLVESGQPAALRLAASVIPPRSDDGSSSATVFGITGPPGVGKSCLVDHIATAWSEAGRSVSVLCVDPSSSLSGGALLADRMRMTESGASDAVHVRSMATRGVSGGLAARIHAMVAVLLACGRDRLIIETVGAGQAELGIATLADRIILVEGPDRGDSIQAEKAGISELCDLIVVNKSDLPGAEQAADSLRSAASLDSNPPPVVLVSARTGAGLDDLMASLQELPRRADATHARARLRLLAALESSALSDARFEELVESMAAGDISAAEAARMLGQEGSS